jgi:hypoxanthine phosphoribosyltransferase
MPHPYFDMPNFQPTPTQYLDLDWATFGELCRALALKVARDYDPEIVVGIARAGVIPAAVVSSILEVEFHALKIGRRDEDDDHVRHRPEIFSAVPREVEGKRVLIVDEITTSGDTLRLALAAVRSAHPAEVRTATSFARTTGYQPDFSALTMDAEVIFPWDHQVFEDGELVTNPRYRGALGD